jgi:hypothetical protein
VVALLVRAGTGLTPHAPRPASHATRAPSRLSRGGPPRIARYPRFSRDHVRRRSRGNSRAGRSSSSNARSRSGGPARESRDRPHAARAVRPLTPRAPRPASHEAGHHESLGALVFSRDHVRRRSRGNSRAGRSSSSNARSRSGGPARESRDRPHAARAVRPLTPHAPRPASHEAGHHESLDALAFPAITSDAGRAAILALDEAPQVTRVRGVVALLVRAGTGLTPHAPSRLSRHTRPVPPLTRRATTNRSIPPLFPTITSDVERAPSRAGLRR